MNVLRVAALDLIERTIDSAHDCLNGRIPAPSRFEPVMPDPPTSPELEGARILATASEYIKFTTDVGLFDQQRDSELLEYLSQRLTRRRGRDSWFKAHLEASGGGTGTDRRPFRY